MTKLLREVFEKASELPDELQDQIARELLEEIEWEACWDSTLESSQEKLDGLAEKALQAYRAGKTKQMGFHTCEISPRRRLHRLFQGAAGADLRPRPQELEVMFG